MDYIVFKLHFRTGVHFGRGSLSDGDYTLGADTVFSALCHEALNMEGTEGLEKLINLVKNNRIRFSDGLPYVGDELYLPKPMKPVVRDIDGDSNVKKAFKNLKFIPSSELATYLRGEMDPKAAAKSMEGLGEAGIKSQAAVRGLEDALPYNVGFYKFKPNSGLYLIVAYSEQSDLDFFKILLTNLSYSGLGGKISSGFGKFDLETHSVSEELLTALKSQGPGPFMILSGAMGVDGELDHILDGAQYLLIKRSGFVSSETYSETPRKKRDFYLFKSGSCFKEQFEGDIFDVGNHGGHPVFRYAKPIFLEVR